MPVQFLPVFNPLTEEAVAKAQTIKYARVTTCIMRPEHLAAIMLDTGRPKDYLRIAMFLEQRAVNLRSLMSVLRRHGLVVCAAADSNDCSDRRRRADPESKTSASP